MATINCQENQPLFDTQVMMQEMESKLGRELPETIKTKLEATLPPALNAEAEKFCDVVCAEHGCQAKQHGTKPVSTFIAQETLQNILLVVLSEPNPSGRDEGLSSPTAFVQ